VPSDLALRRTLTVRSPVDGEKLVLVKKRGESIEHVLMKAALWVLYRPAYPDVRVEDPAGVPAPVPSDLDRAPRPIRGLLSGRPWAPGRLPRGGLGDLSLGGATLVELRLRHLPIAVGVEAGARAGVDLGPREPPVFGPVVLGEGRLGLGGDRDGRLGPAPGVGNGEEGEDREELHERHGGGLTRNGQKARHDGRPDQSPGARARGPAPPR